MIFFSIALKISCVCKRASDCSKICSSKKCRDRALQGFAKYAAPKTGNQFVTFIVSIIVDVLHNQCIA